MDNRLGTITIHLDSGDCSGLDQYIGLIKNKRSIIRNSMRDALINELVNLGGNERTFYVRGTAATTRGENIEDVRIPYPIIYSINNLLNRGTELDNNSWPPNYEGIPLRSSGYLSHLYPETYSLGTAVNIWGVMKESGYDEDAIRSVHPVILILSPDHLAKPTSETIERAYIINFQDALLGWQDAQ